MDFFNMNTYIFTSKQFTSFFKKVIVIFSYYELLWRFAKICDISNLIAEKIINSYKNIN